MPHADASCSNGWESFEAGAAAASSVTLESVEASERRLDSSLIVESHAVSLFAVASVLFTMVVLLWRKDLTSFGMWHCAHLMCSNALINLHTVSFVSAGVIMWLAVLYARLSGGKVFSSADSWVRFLSVSRGVQDAHTVRRTWRSLFS